MRPESSNTPSFAPLKLKEILRDEIIAVLSQEDAKSIRSASDRLDLSQPVYAEQQGPFISLAGGSKCTWHNPNNIRLTIDPKTGSFPTLEGGITIKQLNEILEGEDRTFANFGYWPNEVSDENEVGQRKRIEGAIDVDKMRKIELQDGGQVRKIRKVLTIEGSTLLEVEAAYSEGSPHHPGNLRGTLTAHLVIDPDTGTCFTTADGQEVMHIDEVYELEGKTVANLMLHDYSRAAIDWKTRKVIIAFPGEAVADLGKIEKRDGLKRVYFRPHPELTKSSDKEGHFFNIETGQPIPEQPAKPKEEIYEIAGQKVSCITLQDGTKKLTVLNTGQSYLILKGEKVTSLLPAKEGNFVAHTQFGAPALIDGKTGDFIKTADGRMISTLENEEEFNGKKVTEAKLRNGSHVVIDSETKLPVRCSNGLTIESFEYGTFEIDGKRLSFCWLENSARAVVDRNTGECLGLLPGTKRSHFWEIVKIGDKLLAVSDRGVINIETGENLKTAKEEPVGAVNSNAIKFQNKQYINAIVPSGESRGHSSEVTLDWESMTPLAFEGGEAFGHISDPITIKGKTYVNNQKGEAKNVLDLETGKKYVDSKRRAPSSIRTIQLGERQFVELEFTEKKQVRRHEWGGYGEWVWVDEKSHVMIDAVTGKPFVSRDLHPIQTACEVLEIQRQKFAKVLIGSGSNSKDDRKPKEKTALLSLKTEGLLREEATDDLILDIIPVGDRVIVHTESGLRLY